MKGLYVHSEIGPLKKVLLHRPGEELLNLAPDDLERLLFDDIPFLEIAQQEHDRFAEVLREQGAEVLYLERLCAGRSTPSPAPAKVLSSGCRSRDCAAEHARRRQGTCTHSRHQGVRRQVHRRPAQERVDLPSASSTLLTDLVGRTSLEPTC